MVQLKRQYPGAILIGLDPDPGALRRGAIKARRAGVEVHFERGFSDQLPYRSASLDRVCCTFMLSLLPFDQKLATLNEIRRVLRAGSFHLLDLVKRPRLQLHERLLRPRSQFHLCSPKEMVELMKLAGFQRPSVTGEYALRFWSLVSYVGYSR